MAGTGSIRRRGGGWELRVYEGVDPATGRDRYASRTVHGSRRSAQRALRDLAAEVDHARTHAGTVADLLQRWQAHAAPGWAPTTAAHTRSIIDHHLIPQLGHVRVAELTTADIDDFYGRLLRGGGLDGRPLAPGTVHRVHAVLHRALAQAVRWDWIWRNPASTASPPRVKRADIVPPTPGQVARLLAAVERDDPVLHALLRLVATTGARRGQLLALRWRDLDLHTGVVAFTRAVVNGPDGPVLAATKTDRTHQVELDRVTLDVLRRLRRGADQCASDAGTLVTGDSFLFTCDLDGARPLRPDRRPRCRLLSLRYSVRIGAIMAERFVGVEEARGQLGRLVDQVADGADPIALTKRGQPLAVLVSRDEWEALHELVRSEARDELRRRLKLVRRRVSAAGLDPSAVDEAIEAARKVS